MRAVSDRYVRSILDLPRPAKRVLALLVDSCLCILTIWLAFCFRLNDWVTLTGMQLVTIPVSLLIALPIFITMGLYRAIFRFLGWSAFITVIKAITIYGLAFMVIFTAISFPGIPRTIGIMQPLLLLLAIGLSRFMARYFLSEAYKRILRQNKQTNMLIYGAGSGGRQVAGALSGSADFKVVGYLDDDKSLHGSLIGGATVYDPEKIVELTARLNVRTILLALPKIDRSRRNEILEQLRGARVAVRTVPDLNALAGGQAEFTDLQELDIEDLLGRAPVRPDQALLERNIRGRVVMVTGAAGSIGSELCRGLARLKPAALLILDQNEYGLYALENELLGSNTDSRLQIVPLLASVCDELRIQKIMETWRPNTVYHAAAYKHVPLVEKNPVEGVKTNVFGTAAVARAAINTGAERFILISTDKAVRPTNVMGATKRLAEMALQGLAAEGAKTVLTMVRFGNVLGSSGSVVPLFRQQIRQGGPITLTHPEIIRYFMTVPEATELVIQAGSMARGGDVFVLDMGEPVKIIDLARRMVELSGLTIKDERNPGGDISIVTTGLRPGEKLYEELLIGDNPEPTEHPKIMRARERFVAWQTLAPKLRQLGSAADGGDVEELRRILSELVQDYRPFDGVVDLVSLRQGVSQ
ncbi:capsular biosynthesis protein [Rhizobium sp. R72]|uniref:polysaccharide biosynthesis protein n=1 Tax=unclassified Rhizobium TaxID=2613769 RepID=UPI000B5363AC|nr:MULTISPECIES: nucleoside-diphosphate sugar epimerase/dehydratase [unclassified Rhizobium]OWW04819.1 capsular biosynthesis protein [Rhizobium sp. R72]OWW05876.1 capsular biosynthesis protein [Rhizobium sp. R711]